MDVEQPPASRKPPKFPDAAALPRIAGHVVLDFTNTVDWRDRGRPFDYLVDYGALLAWCGAAELVSGDETQPLARLATRDAAEAGALLRAAIDLRESAYRLLRAAALGSAPAATDIAIVNRMLQRHPLRGRIERLGDGYARRSSASDEMLALPLERLAAATADLLLSPAELRRVHLCHGPGCGWLFLDTSPNRRRRWCSMESCGNRQKARRHYARVKDGGAATD